ncbi:MAG TPA: cell division protein FtsL [Hydrogenophaga sp.]|nr:cell division protein FtsL [Hydrogenophaga sp.]
MIRLNLVLLAAVLVSAFYLVHTQYESRRLYTALDRAKAQSRQLSVEYEQLVVQRRAQATPARVQQLATRQLKMRPVTPGITQYVVVPESLATSSPGAQGARP